MNDIDERVVAMRFQNSQFEAGIKQTKQSLSELHKALEFNGVGDSIKTIASRFSAFGAVAFTAIASLTNSAIDFGKQIAGAVLDPLVEGGKKRALNIEQAKFQFKGLGMDVEKTMASALAAVKGTAYGLDEAAVAASQFGASGIKSGKEMTNALRGISGVAAMAGSSYGDIADVFTKVAGQGRLMGDDLNRLGSRGINAAATLGKAFNKSESEIRKMVSKGKISFQDFSKVMSDAFGEHATKANETYSGSLSNVRAALARIGAAFASVKFENQRNIFNALTPAIDNVAAALKPVIDFYTELTKMSSDKVVELFDAINFSKNPKKLPPFFAALKNVFKFFISIAKPIRDAFLEIFPPTTAETVKSIASAFLTFSKTLKMGEKDSENLKMTFKGVFAVLDIGRMIITGLFSSLGKLFGTMSKGSGSFLESTASIGEFLVKLRDTIRDGNLVTVVIDKIVSSVKSVVDWFKQLGESISNNDGIVTFADSWNAVANALRKVWEFLAPVAKWVGDAMKQVSEAVKTAFETMDFNVLVGLLNVGAIGAVALFIRNGFNKLMGFLKGGLAGAGSGLFDKIKDSFGALTDTLNQMQNTLKSAQLMIIAAAIGILTAAVVALSMIDTGKLFISLGAMGVMFTLMTGAMVILDKFVVSKGFLKMPAIAAAMTGLATAMVILSAALKILSTMDWDELARGMSGMAVGLGLLVAASMLLGKVPVKLLAAAPAMIMISTAMVVLASALKIMATLSWDDIARGMTVLAGSLAIMVGTMKIVGSSTQGAAAMLIISSALTVLGAALIIMAKLSWDEIARALGTLAGSLMVMAIAVKFMTGSIAGAAAMLIVAAAMTVLTGALKIMATMSWDEIGRSMTVLGGSLAILAGAMALMGIPLVLLGAVGITAAALAMMVLAPALKLLGTMSWDDIGRGLTVLASGLVIMAAGGLLLTPAIPAFLGLGAAIALIGLGALAAGIGLASIAAGLGLLAAGGPAAAEALRQAVLVIIGLIPEAMSAFAQGIIDFAVVIANGGAEFTGAMTTLLSSLIDAINTLAPKILDTLWGLLMGMVAKLEENVPIMVDSGLKLLNGILEGIANNLGKTIDTATLIVTTFIDGIAKNLPKVIDSGVNMIITFVESLADGIRKNSERMGAAGGDLAAAIIEGMVNGLGAGIGKIVDAARNLGASALNAAKDILGIHSPSREFMKLGKFTAEGFALGLLGNRGQIQNAYKSMNDMLKDVISSTNRDVEVATEKLKKLRRARKDDTDAIKEAEKQLKKRKSEGKEVSQLEKRIKKLTESRKDNNKAIAETNKQLKTAQQENSRATKARRTLLDNLRDERDELKSYADEYETVSQKLADARKVYSDAKKTRDDHKSNIADQYSQLGEIDAMEGLDRYRDNLQQQIEKTLEFSEKVQKLRDLGLNDKLYKELLSKGVDTIPFIDELLAKGDDGIKDINSLADQLDKASKDLSVASSNTLYQAAVDSAKGIVVGLKAERKSIEDEMSRIADVIVNALKKKLKIKSPSRVMAELGVFANKGLVSGFKSSSNEVAKASANVGERAVSSLQKSLKDISSNVATNMDIVPVIKPVLDLSNIQRDAGQMSNMLQLPTLTLDTTRAMAIDTSNAVQLRRPGNDGESGEGGSTQYFQFTQNNSSPKALSYAEIYRQSNNLISLAKEELKKK